MADGRPSRARRMAPAEVDSHPAVAASHEAALVLRLEQALSALPEAERVAVVAAIGYDGGPAGAAMELGLDLGSDLDTALADADAVTRNGLQLLRAALSDLDPHGTPLT